LKMRYQAMPCARSCSEVGSVNLEQALLVERHHGEWFVAERVVPGAEVHRDRDVTWVVHSGQAWRNAGMMVRFRTSTAERRLDTLLARYRKHGRGMALWISPAATPEGLPELLRARRLRCQKYFPAMLRTLADTTVSRAFPSGLEIRRVLDVTEYEKTPHPAIGQLTTSLRRQAFERLRALLSDSSNRTRGFVAWLKGKPVGAIEVFLGSESAGIHGLSVLDDYQGRGIGSALIEHACSDAAGSRAKTMVLLATTEGQRLYERRGFTEVARFGYWYRSFQRGC
jgi:ribosomal protein S18 acetylase RimI-like enzyme